MNGSFAGFDSVSSIISLVVLGIFGLLTLVGALKGLSRGISRQVIRTATIIISVILSIVLVKFSYNAIFSYFEGKTIEDIVNQISSIAASYNVEINPEDFADLYNFETETVVYILAIPLALVVMPLAFTVSFVIISALMLIVHAIVSGILGFRKKKNNAVTRLLGMALGAVQGAFVAIVIMLPVLGIANIASDAVDTIRANENQSELELQIIELYDNNVKEAVDSPTVSLMSKYGGDWLYKIISTATISGEDIEMSQQVDPVVKVYTEYASHLAGADFTALTEENKAAINAILMELEQSNYFSPLLASVVRGGSYMLNDSEFILEMEEPLKTSVMSIISIFNTSDKTNINTDLATIRDLYFLLSDTGVLKGMTTEGTDILALLAEKGEDNKTPLSKAVDLLSENTRTKPIVGTLTKLSITMVAGAENAEQMDAIYESVKSGINEIVSIKRNQFDSDEEYEDAISDTIENVAVENGILTPEFIEENREQVDEVLDVVSDFVAENFNDVEEFTDEMITDLIIEYYDAYINGEFNFNFDGAQQ